MMTTTPSDPKRRWTYGELARAEEKLKAETIWNAAIDACIGLLDLDEHHDELERKFLALKKGPKE